MRKNETNSRLFLYLFDYRGQYHRYEHRLPFEVDATLTDDSIYLFPYPNSMDKLNKDDSLVSNKMTRLWYNFITYGLPELDEKSKWPSVWNEYGPVLHLNDSNDDNNEINSYFTDGIKIPNLYPEHFHQNQSANRTKSLIRLPDFLSHKQKENSDDHYIQYPYPYPYRHRPKNLLNQQNDYDHLR